ncbi:VOC family protein [Pseudonocardia sp. GCM10023141]|uniref:VOC family protein n=1 Tax=Pseudonocardia sp. GCM10023141 TaxID=3252653 RepID=UPI0036194DF9
MSTHSDPWPSGTPCWVDLAVPDLDAAKAFYSSVVGWTFVDSGAEFGHYSIAQTDGQAAAAIGPLQQEGQPSDWTVYLATADADATAKLITEHGGSLMFEPMEIPGNGRMAIAIDPTGGVFGIWQAIGMTGFGIANEPGSVTWTDARLTDPVAGKAFYSAVFGYTFDPIPGAPDDYSVFSVDGETRGGMGGMMGGPQDAPSHWLSYFSVAEVDAAITTLTASGGTLLVPAEDTPFGRMAVVSDPFGATFSLHQAPPAG